MRPPLLKGPFELTIGGGLSAYRDPRPQLLVISSAGVERNAIIGDDAGAPGVVRSTPLHGSGALFKSVVSTAHSGCCLGAHFHHDHRHSLQAGSRL
jgi:hypothetical protein